MKGYKIVKPLTVKEQEIEEQDIRNGKAKIKLTKTLITLSDVLKYSEGDSDYVPGSYGIGIISESDANFFGLEKGKHVYVEPFKPCEECYNCKNNEPKKCSDLLIAGEDYDGFLCDFYSANSDKIFVLPDSVSDFDALFIGQISLAVYIIDKLGVQKGDYVSIVGGNNFANILAQLLIYYQAVPIVLTNDNDDLENIKLTGIYYALGENDNWVKEVSSITGGRMTQNVVYISDCDIPTAKAFALASYNAKVVFTGSANKSSSVSFSQAVKKQLNIHCISIGAGNTASSINIIANKAVDLSKLKIDNAKYDDVPKVLKSMNEQLQSTGKIYETVINHDNI